MGLPLVGFGVAGALVEGGRYLFARGPLAFVLMLSLALNAALSLLSVTMPLTIAALSRGAAGYGLYQTLAAVGLLATRLTPPQQIAMATTLMAAGFAVLASGTFGILLTGGLVLGLGMLEVAGVTLLKLAVPDGMRGRMLGLVLGANAAGLSAGAYLAGRFATTVDVGLLYAIAAALLFVLSVGWVLLNTRLPLALLCYLAVWPGTVSRGELADSAFEWRSSPATLSGTGKVVTHGSSCAPVTVPWYRFAGCGDRQRRSF